ncbi:MAG: DUF2339 domain-containing protein [Gemmatimonadetes bacterium]|nr:DUF2339 domain-containing protein [Gemmatimonadota bacterium]
MELLIVLNVILLLFLIGTYLSLSGRVKHLEEAIRRHFRETTDPSAGISGRSGSEGPIAEAVVGEDADNVAEEHVGTAPPHADVPLQAQPVSAEPVAGTGRTSSLLRHRTREEWETLIGGKLLNRVGALALIFGVGFFLKYAFDNDWLNETARVLLGGTAGLLLIGGGHRFHRRHMRVFAQGLTGAGAAILYLSIYAAYDFYYLIPQPVAFLLMALVTATNLLLSLRYDARAIALLGWAGGFLTPFLLVTTDLNTLGLFVYVTLLNAGLIAVLLKRRPWRLPEPLGIAATYGTFLIWSFRADLPEGFATALVFLVLWWAMFAALDLCRSFTEEPGNRRWRWTAGAINIIGLFLMLVSLLRHTEGVWSSFGIQFVNPNYAWNYAMVIATVILSLAYFALAGVTARRTEDTPAVSFYSATAVVLAVLAPFMYFDSYAALVAWAIEAFALFWYGVRFQRPVVRHAGTALFALTVLGLYLVEIPVKVEIVHGPPEGDVRTAAYWVLAGALLACTGMMRDRLDSRGGRWLWNAFHVAWTALLLVWGTLETLDYFGRLISTLADGSPEQLQNLRQLAVSGVWVFGAAMVMILGRWMDIRALRAAAIVYFGITVVKVFVFDLMFLDTLYRIAAFLGLSAILIAVSYLYYRNRPAS